MVKTLMARRRYLLILCVLLIIAYAVVKPQAFFDLWLSRDQQAQLLFNHGHYDRAATRYSDNRWQAYSLYGAERYDDSATVYSQFVDVDARFAQANALAQGARYVDAKNRYLDILAEHPGHHGAKANLALIQGIIDEINLMSESQQPEAGDSPKELGEEPQRGDGADKQEMRKAQIEQLSSEQLLLDPSLNEMWLRQVQRDPGKFIAQKFYMQYEREVKNE